MFQHTHIQMLNLFLSSESLSGTAPTILRGVAAGNWTHLSQEPVPRCLTAPGHFGETVLTADGESHPNCLYLWVFTRKVCYSGSFLDILTLLLKTN